MLLNVESFVREGSAMTLVEMQLLVLCLSSPRQGNFGGVCTTRPKALRVLLQSMQVLIAVALSLAPHMWCDNIRMRA